MEKKTTTKSKKVKFCKHCGSEMKSSAKICPNCKKKQGVGIFKGVLIAFIALIIIGALFGKSDSTKKSPPVNSKNVQNDSGSDSSAQKEDTPQMDESVPEETSNNGNTIHIGESFENNDLRVTVNSYNPEFTGYNQFMPPSEGNRYIEVSFTYENVGSNGDKYVSIYDCDCYADNTACEQAYIGGEDFINGNISPGRNVSFNVYYQVPVSAGTIELEYDASFWSSEKVVILLQ